MAPDFLAVLVLWGGCALALHRGLIQSRLRALGWALGLQICAGVGASMVGLDDDAGFIGAMGIVCAMGAGELRRRSVAWEKFIKRHNLGRQGFFKPRWKGGTSRGQSLSVRWAARGFLWHEYRLRVSLSGFHGVHSRSSGLLSGGGRTGASDFDERYVFDGDPLTGVIVATPAVRNLLLEPSGDGIINGDLAIFEESRDPTLAEAAVQRLTEVSRTFSEQTTDLITRLRIETDFGVRIRLAELVTTRCSEDFLPSRYAATNVREFAEAAASIGQPSLTIVVAPWLDDGVEGLVALAGSEQMLSIRADALMALSDMVAKDGDLRLSESAIETVQRCRQHESQKVVWAASKLLEDLGILRPHEGGALMLEKVEGHDGALEVFDESRSTEGALAVDEAT